MVGYLETGFSQKEVKPTQPLQDWSKRQFSWAISSPSSNNCESIENDEMPYRKSSEFYQNKRMRLKYFHQVTRLGYHHQIFLVV